MSTSYQQNNDAADGFREFCLLFKDGVEDIRQLLIECRDLAHTYDHINKRYGRVDTKIDWIRETLQNPKRIIRQPDYPYRDQYLNILFKDHSDRVGAPFLVVVTMENGFNQLWTAYKPKWDYYDRLYSGKAGGEVVWPKQ